MVVIDQWLKSAIVDNNLVADLLLSLNHSSSPKPLPFFSRWGANKPRSKLRPPSSAAFSPTSPLSWTATADAFESSRSKTFSELVEEESSLMKERIYLTKEIENQKATFVAQRAGNESFKRRKLDLGSTSCENLSTLPRIVPSTSKSLENATTRIVIPDLNMMPPPDEEEEESYANFPHGMS
ncbi:unnamed protein product [Lupinus luteus]|uniref:Uncharacterized protein n=1 Tax=Lupinus luteus TaxID=3873 RepID=A0AAV1XNG4_LUPLU